MTFYSLESSRGRKRANMPHIVDTEMEDLDEAQLEELYTWVDEIPLSRPKRNMTRDFSDGDALYHRNVCSTTFGQSDTSLAAVVLLHSSKTVLLLVAEVVKHFLPHIVDTHNYPPANSTQQKMSNWYLLNRKVFQKMHFQLSDDVIRKVSMCTPGVVEKVMLTIRTKVDLARHQLEKGKQAPVPGRSSRLSSDKPEVDQNMAMLPQTRLPKAKPSPGVSSNAGPYKGSKAKGFMETDVIPRIMLEEKEQECLAKDETIQILQAKVRRLEHLIHLKDIRIDDLQGKIEAMRPTGKR